MIQPNLLFRSFFIMLVLINLSAAITSSFGGVNNGATVGSTACYNLGADDSIADTSELHFDDGVSIFENKAAELTAGASISEYRGANDPYGRFSAATYAYLTDADSASWSGYARSGSCYAEAGETVKVTNGKDPFFGGFAYNNRGDYAAAQLKGGIWYSADLASGDPVSMTYTNYMKANIASAKASQDFQKGYGDMIMWNFAEHGDIANEAKSAADLWKWNEDAQIFEPNIGPAFASPYDQYAHAHAILDDANIKIYSGSAYSDKYAARSSQSLDASSIGNAPIIQGLAAKGQAVPGPKDKFTQEANVAACGNNWVGAKYSTSASITAKETKATGSLSIKSAESIEKWSHARDGGEDGYIAKSDAKALGQASGQAPGILASMTSKDSAWAKTNYASVSESLSATGIYITRGVLWDGMMADTPVGYSAMTNMKVGDLDAVSSSSLKGSSNAEASLAKGAKITGSWKGTAASGGMVWRYIDASDGINNAYTESKIFGTFSFKESAWSKMGTLYAL
jgi:hypothetical protein